MKKELIIVIIIVIAIIILDTITHNYTKINFAKINEQLEQIKEISEDIYIMEKEQDIVENASKEENENDNKTSKQEKLKEKIKTMEEDWKTINNKTALYIEHEELEISCLSHSMSLKYLTTNLVFLFQFKILFVLLKKFYWDIMMIFQSKPFYMLVLLKMQLKKLNV